MAKFCTLPVVDLQGGAAKLRHDGGSASQREAIAVQLKEVLQTSGMCHVVNHGVSLDLIKDLQDQLFEYFHSTDEAKRKYHVTKLPQVQNTGGVNLLREGLHTFESKDGEKQRTSDWRESLMYYTKPASVRHQDHWPEEIREILPAFSDAMYDLSYLVVEMVAESLGLPASAFGEAIGEALVQLMAIHFYPVVPRSETSDAKNAMAAHTDTTLLTTLLCNETPGLQMLQDGEWVTVEPLPGAFIVQPGVFMEVLTNGQYKAMSHRVATPNGRRVSVVAGLRLPQTLDVKPIARLIGNDTPAVFKPFNVGHYMKLSREVGVLGKDGELLDSFKIVNPVH